MLPEDAHVLDDRVDQHALQHVQGAVAEVGWRGLVAAGTLGRLGDRVGRDHDQALRPQVEGRLDRRVEARAAVEVPTARLTRVLDPHRREQDRDCRRRTHVLVVEPRLDVVDRVRLVPDPLAVSLEEHDRAPGAGTGRDAGEALGHVGVDVLVDRLPVDPALEIAHERLGVEQARQAHARKRQDLARIAEQGERRLAHQDRADHASLGDLAPAFQASLGGLVGRLVAARGEVGGVDRADAGPDVDVRPLPAIVERGQQHRHHAGLVCAPRPAPRQDESYPADGLASSVRIPAGHLPRLLRRVAVHPFNGYMLPRPPF